MALELCSFWLQTFSPHEAGPVFVHSIEGHLAVVNKCYVNVFKMRRSCEHQFIARNKEIYSVGIESIIIKFNQVISMFKGYVYLQSTWAPFLKILFILIPLLPGRGGA